MTEDPRRSAPAALRNRDAITEVLSRVAPERGRALEIASGSGEHIIRFARARPGLRWHPTDPDPGQRASIAAWVAAEDLANVEPPAALDATEVDWASGQPPADLVVLVNLLHLLPQDGVANVIRGIARVLVPGGIAAIYGPFLRNGETAGDGDAAFHASLKARDPAIGLKDVADIVAQFRAEGLNIVETVKMPANNLVLVFERTGTKRADA